MYLDSLVVALYTIVDDWLRENRLLPVGHGPGRLPVFSDSEVLTLAILSQYPRRRSERGFYRFADTHLRPYFPDLLSQGQLNRRIQALEPELKALQRYHAATLAVGSEVYHILETTLISAVVRIRARRNGLFAGQATLGRCASKTERVYGAGGPDRRAAQHGVYVSHRERGRSQHLKWSNHARAGYGRKLSGSPQDIARREWALAPLYLRFMERVRLTPPDGRYARGEKARLYIRWMPRLGAEAVALYELLRTLPEAGVEAIGTTEMAELLRTGQEGAEAALEVLLENGFATEREGWIEVHDLPPGAESVTNVPGHIDEVPSVEALEDVRGAPGQSHEVEVIRAEPEGVSADDYFRYMGSLPSPHILEFLNGYCGRDGVEPDVVREALKIASERDARKMGYVRSILERWVERGVKTVADVELFEQERKLRLVAEGGGEYGKTGGGYETGKEVSGGTDRQPAAGFKEGYEWFFGE